MTDMCFLVFDSILLSLVRFIGVYIKEGLARLLRVFLR